MSESFKIIETQEQFDAMVKDRLERARESVRKEYQDYESLKEKVNGFQKEKESYETKIASLTKSNEEITGKYKALETDSLKVKIALENGIPFEMANRLSGTDVESITNDAKLLSGFVSKTHQQPRRNPEAGSSDDAYSSMIKKIKK
ncbi:capsid assembly scaffolding protein Gp46 family protein [Floccifex sp.]|uniref:capsid assembly scaffolding protein Gp46 family protein n=1 Tax=Floccifex sp. TaxID=2815810 RepID=UPI003F11DEE4